MEAGTKAHTTAQPHDCDRQSEHASTGVVPVSPVEGFAALGAEPVPIWCGVAERPVDVV
jgi:hypothetical protein